MDATISFSEEVRLNSLPSGGVVIGAVGSKSYAQRAIIAAMCCERGGRSVVSGVDRCSDVEAVLGVVRTLGGGVDWIDERTVSVEGCFPFFEVGASVIDVGESGFAARVLGVVLTAGAFYHDMVLNQQCGFVLQGRGTLLGRDMSGLVEVLEQLGARVFTAVVSSSANSTNTLSSTAGQDWRLPIRVEVGRLGHSGPANTVSSGAGVVLEVNGALGSQVMSGVLMAEPLFRLAGIGDLKVQVRALVSGGYVQMTREVVGAFTVGGTGYFPVVYSVAGDWSSATLMLVAGVVSGRGVRIQGLEVDELQADCAILEVLAAVGAGGLLFMDDYGVAIKSGERASDMLSAFEWDATDCPDMFVALAVLAAFARGTSSIRGVGRLASKESDRGRSIVAVLEAFGVMAECQGDVMVIRGGGISSWSSLSFGSSFSSVSDSIGGEFKHECVVVESMGDHRIAMMGAVMGLVTRREVVVRGAQCVEKSYARFWDDFLLFGGVKVTNVNVE